jgi:hypothetical protein
MNEPADRNKEAAEKLRRPKLVKPLTAVPLFGKSAALPLEPAKEWDAVLRCHRCSGRFTIHHLPLKRIALVPQIASCPHCAARSSTAAKKLHHIIDLRQAKD